MTPQEKAYAADQRLARRCARHGIGTFEFKQAWKRQRGRCVICRKPLDLKKRSGCQIEHNHKIKDRRKAFRGLACWWCNMKAIAPVERMGQDRVLAVIHYLWRRP